MGVKSYLQQIRTLRIRIAQWETELSRLESSIGSLPAMRYDTDRVRSSSQADQIPNEIIRRDELARTIRQETDQLLELQHKIIGQIQQLARPEYVELLYKRYVEDKNFDRIADEMGYSYDWVKHLHRKALQEFERRHPKTLFNVL